ncbi:MAG: ATP-binding cassette domain-containing protein [Cyanobacteria bacterium J06614_10]
MTASTAALSFDQVTMRATTGVVEILKDLTFSIEPGEFVALVGSSGSGKTSLLRLMNRLSEYSSGQILVEGRAMRQLPVVNLRRKVTLVNQESRLLGMTVQETLGYPLRLRNRSTADIDKQVAHWAERLKIPKDWMSRTTVHLSLGQRQRVAIARALIGEPDILLLDEPTSAQDVGYSEFLLSRLADLATKQKLTVVMANHQIELLSHHVTRLLHLEDGRLVNDAPAEAVNWAQLREQLVLAESEAQEAWGD